MLKARILTGCVLIPIVFWFLFYASPSAFLYATIVVMLLASWEWSRLMGLTHLGARFLYFYIICMMAAGAFALMLSKQGVWIFWASIFWWIFALILIVCYPRYKSWNTVFFRGIMGAFVLIPWVLALNLIRSWHEGTQVLFFVLTLIWLADTAAYFVGRRYGCAKLAPLVSPGKSVQGLLGAVIASLLYAFLVATFFAGSLSFYNKLIFIGLCLITVLFSVAGDLFESMLKREVGVKDSGVLLPGHGGILDRVDSLTAALPIFAFGCIIFLKQQSY